MTSTKVHIINHTHWDREWFLTSVYTNQWIPPLIDRLEQLVRTNPGYCFLLDGQTLVIEDLLNLEPDHKDKVDSLVEKGNLIIGPYYCQPDWRMTGGESLIRNLLYGWQDMQEFGGINRIGWLVDTFGHISQAPQIHELFDLEAVFIWRGVPELEPYFNWQGANGQQLFTINLFGGYRNLYGISHVPEVAIKRLAAEVKRLRSYYPGGDIPLFDGYDLEQNPEDPIGFFRQLGKVIPPKVQIKESAPRDYVQELQGKFGELPTITGELLSGKYGAVFPGTLSTRTYLKIMHRDCEHLLYQLCEPLAVLACLKGRKYFSQLYEEFGRLLLQNAIHDCICGVSIDQVHEKMEFNYKELFGRINEDVRTSLNFIMRGFEPGMYAVSTNPFSCSAWQVVEDWVYLLSTDGIGVWKTSNKLQVERPNKPITEFEWRNDHYQVRVTEKGEVQLGDSRLGRLLLTEEKGDAYSDEAGLNYSVGHVSSPLIIEQKSSRHCIIRFDCECQLEEAKISATFRLIFDQSPMIRWLVDLDSQGVDFRIDIQFNTGISGDIYAGMPFDVVKRPKVDKDLLPRHLDLELRNVLLGQRELVEVRTFPFHDFVAITDQESTAVVMAKGIRAYQVDDNGVISLILRRSVEWLTDPELKNRSGDAGPIMYVPDARCERSVRHEIAVLIDNTNIDDIPLFQINGEFQNPPLFVNANGEGDQTEWQFLHEDIQLSSLIVRSDKVLARIYNQTMRTHSLNKKYRASDVWGNRSTFIKSIPAKKIQTLEIDQDLPESSGSQVDDVLLSASLPNWRVGENKGLPDPEIIKQIERKIAQLEVETDLLTEQLTDAQGLERHHIKYRYYLHMRELYELKLSAELNKRKYALQGELDHDYLFSPDPEIGSLGEQLNELRIKRRIYDYVVRAIEV
jgi:alpha-mannosidase